MARAICLVALLLMFAVTFDRDAEARTLRAYDWQNRILLVFSPSMKAETMKTQLQWIDQNRDDLIERDFAVFAILPDQVKTLIVSRGAGPLATSKATAAALRKRYKVNDDDFQVLLIGKDTGVKRRSNDPYRNSAALDQVDRMPMRQQEIIERGGS
ncbi:MAG: DUF4174 domain-containing protein [Pseudomonadota bacterium]